MEIPIFEHSIVDELLALSSLNHAPNTVRKLADVSSRTKPAHVFHEMDPLFDLFLFTHIIVWLPI